MAHAVADAKNWLVHEMNRIAEEYSFTFSVNLDTEDQEIRTVYRNLSRRTHPDRGGLEDDQKCLNNAYELWQRAIMDAQHVSATATPDVEYDAEATSSFEILPRVTWEYTNSTGDEWRSMDRSYSQQHEEHFNRGDLTFEYDFKFGKHKRKVYEYVVDFVDMTQTNITTGTVRRIRRRT